MPRYIVTEYTPIWVKEFYEVDAANEEECEEAYYAGDYEWLGHDLEETIEGRDRYGYKAERMETGRPFIAYPTPAEKPRFTEPGTDSSDGYPALQEAEEWCRTHTIWDNNPKFPVDVWRYEVANDECRVGYHQWIIASAEAQDMENLVEQEG